MKLVVISNMAHYRRADGQIVGHGATARELSFLASLFQQVRHVACLHDESPPASARAYDAPNIELVPVPPAGGDTLAAKLAIGLVVPRYLATIRRELAVADAVHIRCPANISAIAVAMLGVVSAPSRRWVKYAGNWTATDTEPRSYRLQRRLLAAPLHRAQVTVNGEIAQQPRHVHSLDNPCLTEDELTRGKSAAATKSLTPPVRLLFAGHLGAAKNPRYAIETTARLRERGIDAQLDLAGEGDDLAGLRTDVEERRLSDFIRLHGEMPRASLDALYAAAHFVILPSQTEGWPKVLGEGMAAGALPVAAAVGSIPAVLARHRIGAALPTTATPDAYADAIAAYIREPARWKSESVRAVAVAEGFSYARYLDEVRSLLQL